MLWVCLWPSSVSLFLCSSAVMLLGTCSLLLQEQGHCRDATAAAAPEEGILGGAEGGGSQETLLKGPE